MSEQSVTAAPTAMATAIAELGPWFHNLELPGGVQTAPNHPLGDFPQRQWYKLRPYLPKDLQGWHVLDVGCNAGFYTFEMVKRGAAVTAIDVDERYLRQARWAAEVLDLTSAIEFRQMQVYDLAHEATTYDLVIFMGVFYHLRYPLLGLDIVAQKARRQLIFQSLMTTGPVERAVPVDLPLSARNELHQPWWPQMAFIEHRLANDPTNWWAPNAAAVPALLRASGLRIVQEVGNEIYLCAPATDHSTGADAAHRAEFLAATGQQDGACAGGEFSYSQGGRNGVPDH